MCGWCSGPGRHSIFQLRNPPEMLAKRLQASSDAWKAARIQNLPASDAPLQGACDGDQACACAPAGTIQRQPSRELWWGRCTASSCSRG